MFFTTEPTSHSSRPAQGGLRQIREAFTPLLLRANQVRQRRRHLGQRQAEEPRPVDPAETQLPGIPPQALLDRGKGTHPMPLHFSVSSS